MITTHTRVINVDMSPRLKNALVMAHPDTWRTLTIGDLLDMSDAEFLRLPNVGVKTWREWKRLTAHLRDGPTEGAEEETEEHRIRKQVRTALNTIAGAHKTLAKLYADLAQIALPLDQK